MSRTRTLLLLATATVAGIVVAIARHRGAARGQQVPGGILIADAASYDAISHRLLLGSLFALGIGVVAGEVQQGTARISWALARSRLRWLWLRSWPIGLIGVVVALPLGAATARLMDQTSPSNIFMPQMRGPIVALHFLIARKRRDPRRARRGWPGARAAGFRHAVPTSPSSARSAFGSGLFVDRGQASGPLSGPPLGPALGPGRGILEQRFDVLLTDVVTPGISGLESPHHPSAMAGA